MAIDESGLPYVMPTSVARVTADGKPTKFLIDWEEGTRNWYYTNAVATDQRITTVKAETDTALASFEEDINAVITDQAAIVESVTTLTATFGNVTAGGQIYFAAKAAPSGSAAAYGLYLTAGDAYTGFEAIAKSDGTSAIGFTAGQFVFTDSGTAEQVFTYSGGQFHLTGNVEIDGNLVVNGSIITDKIASGAVTRFGRGETTNDAATLSITLDVRAGDDVNLFLEIRPSSGFSTAGNRDIVVSYPGLATQTRQAYSMVSDTSMSGSGEGATLVTTYRIAPMMYLFTWTAPSTGSRTITVAPMTNVAMRGVAIAVSK